VEEATRLHREALKQSATDPLSGKIDVSILTTGQSENKRKRRHLVKLALENLIGKKGKVHTINYMKTWTELKEASEVVRRLRSYSKLTKSYRIFSLFPF